MNLESAAAQEDLAEDTNVDVMAARPLHRIMVTLNKPARWSNFRSALSILFLAALPALFWWLLPADFPLALFIGAALLLFFMSDLLILAALPRLRISFGAWQPQLFQLALLRTPACHCGYCCRLCCRCILGHRGFSGAASRRYGRLVLGSRH